MTEAAVDAARQKVRALLADPARCGKAQSLGWLAGGQMVDARPSGASFEVFMLEGKRSADGAAHPTELLLVGSSLLYFLDTNAGAIVEVTPDLGDAFAERARRSASGLMAGDVRAEGTSVASVRIQGAGELLKLGLAQIGKKIVGIFQGSSAESVVATVKDPAEEYGSRVVNGFIQNAAADGEASLALRVMPVSGRTTAFGSVPYDMLAKLDAAGAKNFVLAFNATEARAAVDAATPNGMINVLVDPAWFRNGALDASVKDWLVWTAAESARGATEPGANLRFVMAGSQAEALRNLGVIGNIFPRARLTLASNTQTALGDVGQNLIAGMDDYVVLPGGELESFVGSLVNVVVIDSAGMPLHIQRTTAPNLRRVYMTPGGRTAFTEERAADLARLEELEANPAAADAFELGWLRERRERYRWYDTLIY